MQSEKPKLPSIHLMLQGVDTPTLQDSKPGMNDQRLFGHRRHCSDEYHTVPSSTAPLSYTGLHGASGHGVVTPSSAAMMAGLQKLSISKPAAPVEPNLNSSYAPPPRLQSFMLYPQQRTPKNMHSRSFSDYTHPYATNAPAGSKPSNGQYLSPVQPYHRRAISTNTLDFLLQPRSHHVSRPDSARHPPSLYTSSSTSSVTTMAPYSPTLSAKTSTSSPTSDEFDSHSDYSAEDETLSPQRYQDRRRQAQPSVQENGNNKYQCPYCNKGFSRPSSLRIHTYSHTGEKPFACPEEGCSRKFSVQSNMRRHLRVHRLGRPIKRNHERNNNTTTKPIAVKPRWIGIKQQS